MKKKKVRISRSDCIYYTVCYIIGVILAIIVLLPILHVLAASFSSAQAVSQGKVLIFPVEFSLEAYKRVLAYDDLWIGYRNTIFYTLTSTVYSVFSTMLAAYPMSKKDLFGKKQIMYFFTFTMFFGGGLILNYLLMKSLGLLNNPLVMIIPGGISVYNMIVARTFIESNITSGLTDAAKIDGAGDFKIFFRIIIPLSKTIIAVLALWCAVGMWNSYFNALIYLNDKELYPLQIFLREILITNTSSADLVDTSMMELEAQMAEIKKLMKYAVIVVSTLPVMCFYPFLQKHFVKGVMIGSIKG